MAEVRTVQQRRRDELARRRWLVDLVVALVIGSALLVIDGRVLKLFQR